MSTDTEMVMDAVKPTTNRCHIVTVFAPGQYHVQDVRWIPADQLWGIEETPYDAPRRPLCAPVRRFGAEREQG